MDERRGYIIVFNSKAGRGRAYEALRRVTSRLDGCLAPVIETKLDATFAPMLREWIRHVRSETGCAPIAVSVGGDGTLSMLLNAIESLADISVAVAPCGSGNDFAQAIGARDVGTALDLLESGSLRRVDVGLVNGRRFANCVGMGLDAEVGALAARLRRRGYPPAASYNAAALIGLFFVKAVGVTIEANGKRLRIDNGVMVTVGNGPWYGGGFRGAPDAKIDDGILDCFAFANVNGVMRRLALMRRIRAGTHAADPNVTPLRASELIVAFDRDVAMHVDGETLSVRRAEIAVMPGALNVFAAA